MNSNADLSCISLTSPEYNAKRRKLTCTTSDLVKRLLHSAKGEVIQALHIVFEKDSFTFETCFCSNLQNKFICYLNVEGYTFIGYGITKVAAKSSASKAALTYLVNEFKDDEIYSVERIPVFDPSESSNDDLGVADTIANLVLQKYNELRSSTKNSLPWYKMIAGIVMVTGSNYQDGTVVALSTGSKCISKDNLVADGKVIIDSHAEILCRRALMHYLMRELERPRNESIFNRVSKDRYELRSNVKFYLYANSAPCGDCRIFVASSKDNAIDKHPNRISRGVLRVKLDGGNSTVPISSSEKYESDNRLIIMSCSDKLLKMNALGVQGALLSYFVEPIYFSGIVIGDLYHKSHVIRALYGRLEEEEYSINKIHVYGVSKELKVASKSPKTNMNWVVGEVVEVLNSVTGKTILNEMSRLCKYSLFRKFLHLFDKIIPSERKQDSYEQFKKTVYGYQNNKQIFLTKLQNRNLGTWVLRNPSLDYFQVAFDEVKS